MFFSGNCIAGYKHSSDYSKINMENISATTVDHGIFDKVTVTTDTSDTAFDSGTWDYDTVLIANFDGNLTAGNIAYQIDQVSAIRIKHRKSGTYDWNTLYEKPVDKADDLIFDYYDKYAANNTEYDYCAVPIINGAEGRLDVNTIKSQFDGIFIFEKDAGYHTELDIEKSTITRNEVNNVVTTLKGRYPIVISNGNSDYYSGSFRMMFLPFDNNDRREYTKVGAYEYREHVMDFLTNKKPKIMKLDDGRMFLVRIIGNVQDENDRFEDYVHTSFEWVQIGDVSSSEDLYMNGFIDVNVEG